MALPAAAIVEQLMRAALAGGRGEDDHSGLITVLEDLARRSACQGDAERRPDRDTEGLAPAPAIR